MAAVPAAVALKSAAFVAAVASSGTAPLRSGPFLLPPPTAVAVAVAVAAAAAVVAAVAVAC